MEVDLDALKRGWSLVLINGLGMIFLNFAFFTGIALALFQVGILKSFFLSRRIRLHVISKCSAVRRH